MNGGRSPGFADVRCCRLAERLVATMLAHLVASIK